MQEFYTIDFQTYGEVFGSRHVVNILAAFWGLLGHLGRSWENFEAFWEAFGESGTHLGSILEHLGSILEACSIFGCNLGSNLLGLVQFEGSEHPSWAQVGPKLGQVGPSWGHVGPKLVLCR